MEKAWILVWTPTGDVRQPVDEVVGFLEPSTRKDEVATHLETVFVQMRYSLKDMWDLSRGMADSPEAKVVHDGLLEVGSGSPYLHAQLVKDVNVSVSETGVETVTWTIPFEDGDEVHREFTREETGPVTFE